MLATLGMFHLCAVGTHVQGKLVAIGSANGLSLYFPVLKKGEVWVKLHNSCSKDLWGEPYTAVENSLMKEFKDIVWFEIVCEWTVHGVSSEHDLYIGGIQTEILF